MPAALISAVLLSFPLHWMVVIIAAFLGDGPGMQTARTLERPVMALMMPMTLIYFGSLVAPRSRRIVSYALATLPLVILGVASYYALSNACLPNNPDCMVLDPNSLWMAIPLDLLSVSIGVFLVSRKESRDRLKTI